MGDFEEVDILERIRAAKTTASSAEERDQLNKAERLVTLSRSYFEVNRFKVGDLVQWKPGMRNRRCPDYDEVVIVSAVMDFVSFNPEKSAGSPYFREPHTMKIAFIDEDDGEFVEFCVDGQRFQPVSEEDCVPRKIQALRERLQTLLSPSGDIHVGDRVYWKPEMKHKKRPNHEPAIVMEVLEQPILDEDRPGSQYWHEPLDIKIAMRDSDGEFVAYYFDSRRFHKIDDDDETYGEKNEDDDEDENHDDDDEDNSNGGGDDDDDDDDDDDGGDDDDEDGEHETYHGSVSVDPTGKSADELRDEIFRQLVEQFADAPD